MSSAFQYNAFQHDAFQTESPGVGASLSTDYRIAAAVGVDLTTDYKIGIVGADLTTTYFIHVGDLVNGDVGLDYHIYNYVSSSALTFDYQIVAAVGLDLAIDYVIDPKAWVAMFMDYRIAAGEAHAELTTDYRLCGKVGADLSTDYQIAGSLIARADLTTTYAIDAVRDVVVRYDDIDITSYLVYRECEFVSQTNGSVGTASVLLRDAAFAWNFTIGKRLELFINGDLLWSGYVMKVGREYPFSYEDLQANVQKLPRFIRIQASDINILFERRYTCNQATPTIVEGPTFKADNTPDIDAIRQLCDAWLDLTGDEIDTVSLVEHVGEINVDQPANPFQAGETWKEAMYSIASLPAAVFYITPDRKLVYTDVDTVTNDMVLSDQPELVANGVGFKNGKWQAFGDRLCNDYLAWGVAQAPRVFKRLESEPSIELHGRWQDSVINQTVYKQATINKIADRQLNGSPGSRRGHKDDRNAFVCSTFQPGFMVAQKVRVISNVFDFDDVLPIRQMRISFPSPTAPRYDLILSHEIDVFGFFDVIRLKPIPKDKPGPPPLPPVPPVQPVYCTVLDDFSRFGMYHWDPDDANLRTGTGWGDGEHLSWTVNEIYLYCDGGGGCIDVKMPEWPSPYSFGGGELHATARIPDDIYSNDIVIAFSLYRLDRVLPTVLAMMGASGKRFDDQDIRGWEGDGWPADYDPNVPGEYGAYYYNGDLHVPSDVVKTDCSADMLVEATAGTVNKVIVRGSRPTYWEGTYHNNPGGMLPGVYSYAGGAWTAYGASGGGGSVNYESKQPPGLSFFGGWHVGDIFCIGPDTTEFSFNQAVAVEFQVGGHITTIGKPLGPFALTNGQASNQPFDITTSSPGGGFSDYYTHNIEPGFNYYMRWYRPTSADSYIKFWEAGPGSDEPTEWQAFDGSHPPYGYDLDGNLIPWPFGHPTPSPLSGEQITISAQVFAMQQYGVRIDAIWACTPEDLIDGQVPVSQPILPSGSEYSEIFATVTPAVGNHTVAPYVPGSLILWCNGIVERKGIDYTETDPTTGSFTLLFTPDFGDKIIVRYIVA